MKNTYLLLSLVAIPFMVGCEDENSASHNQGADCLACHKNFTSGATVFNKLNAQGGNSTDAASGYSIQLLLENNTTIKYSSSRGIGNINYIGDRGAINKFTAEIIDQNGKVVNKSMTNSHGVGRLACNTCHSSTGNSGAPGRIVNYNYIKSLASKIK